MNNNTKAALRNFRETIKLLCGFLTGIALTNALAELASHQKSTVTDVVTPVQWTLFFFLMCLMCRFFFGNIVHLNSDKDDDPFEVVVDGITIVVESLLLAYMAFFTTDPHRLFVFVCILFAIDLVWWALSLLVSRLRKKRFDVDRRISVSQVISALTVGLFLFWGSDIGFNWHAFWSFRNQLNGDAIMVIAIGNTLADSALNGPRYFGLKWKLGIVAKVTP